MEKIIMDFDEILMNFKIPMYKIIKKLLPEIKFYTEEQLLTEPNYYINWSDNPLVEKKAKNLMYYEIQDFYQKHTIFNKETVEFIKNILYLNRNVKEVIVLTHCIDSSPLTSSKRLAITDLSNMLGKKIEIYIVNNPNKKVELLLGGLSDFKYYFEDNSDVINNYLKETRLFNPGEQIKEIFIPMFGWTDNVNNELADKKGIKINYYNDETHFSNYKIFDK